MRSLRAIEGEVCALYLQYETLLRAAHAVFVRSRKCGRLLDSIGAYEEHLQQRVNRDDLNELVASLTSADVFRTNPLRTLDDLRAAPQPTPWSPLPFAPEMVIDWRERRVQLQHHRMQITRTTRLRDERLAMAPAASAAATPAGAAPEPAPDETDASDCDHAVPDSCRAFF